MAATPVRCTLLPNQVNPISVELHTANDTGTFNIVHNPIEPVVKDDFDGIIVNFASPTEQPKLKVVCLTLRDDGAPCGSSIENDKRNLSSHVSDFHQPGSAYKRKDYKSRKFKCPEADCPKVVTAGFNAYHAHRRGKRHGHRGPSDDLWDHEVLDN
jgi:hypothetical protein